MRRIYTLLFTLSVAFVLTGCGPDPSAQLEQDSAAIIRQAIVVKLNEEIANNYGNQSFLLAPGKLLLVSPGVNQAVNLAGQETFKPLEIISAARRYGATKVICNPVGLSSSRIRKKKNNDYPYQVKLTISVDVTYEMYENFSGVPVHAVTPPDWAAWSSEKKTEFIQELYSKLAPAEFDYQKIAEESSGNSEVIRDNWSFDAVWNQSRGHWELEGDQKLEVDAPAPTWPSARESAAALRRHFESENLVAYQGTYFSADDVELAKKLDAGLVYVNGKWMDPKIIAAAQGFSAALSAWNTNHNFSDLEKMLRELRRLADSELYATAAQLSIDGLLHSIEWMEKNENKKSLERLAGYMRENASLSAITPEKILARIETAQKNVDEKIRVRYQATLRKVLAETTELQERCRELDALLQKFSPALLLDRDKEELNLFRPYFPLNSSLKTYLVYLAILKGNREVIREFWKSVGPQFSGLYQTCSKCNGQGEQVCRMCNGTGVCPQCRGTGRRTIKNPDGSYSTVSCSRRCPFCPRSPVCSSCRGLGIVFTRARVQQSVAAFYEKMMTNLHNEIQFRDEVISRIKEKIASGEGPDPGSTEKQSLTKLLSR